MLCESNFLMTSHKPNTKVVYITLPSLQYKVNLNKEESCSPLFLSECLLPPYKGKQEWSQKELEISIRSIDENNLVIFLYLNKCTRLVIHNP